jgi:hypothetical protein
MLPAASFGQAIELHTVPVPVKSYRLLAMSMDEDGFIWTGSIHRVMHRYDPRTGKVEDFRLPYDTVACSCICAGKKVYVLGQTYPRLVIYDRAAGKFSEAKYPSEKPDVWYGTGALDGRHLYLFDRGGGGLVKWDTETDTGKAIAYAYKSPPPSGGRYDTRDKALWCHLSDNSKGRYEAVGIARFDVTKDEFTGYYPFPSDDADLKPYADPEATLFFPDTLKGKLMPFDFKEKRFCKFLSVPKYGELFGFIGGATAHKGRYYFSLSTYNGTETGCDGKPFHFCNALLEFDPKARKFAFPTLEAKDAYYQVAYTLSAGGEFYATGSNIREADGKLNQARPGEIVFWQSRKPEKQ